VHVCVCACVCSAAINALHVVNEKTLASGDDDGVVKVWDVRTQRCVAEYDEHADYVSTIRTCEQHNELVAASGDGTLSIMDWRNKKIELSYQLEDEPLSLAIIKRGTRVVCGTQEGALGIYTWGKWDDVTDRMLGHPASVDCIIKLGEDTVVTGSSDGFIRLVDILPHRIRGVLGEHQGFPIEALELSGTLGMWVCVWMVSLLCGFLWHLLDC
jgi:WD40 repeat protein